MTYTPRHTDGSPKTSKYLHVFGALGSLFAERGLRKCVDTTKETYPVVSSEKRMQVPTEYQFPKWRSIV